MRKKIWLPFCAIVAIFACAFIIWNLFIDNFVPYEMRSYSVDIGIKGDVYMVSDIETELRQIIENLEDKTDNIELSNAKYRLNSDETGTVCFSFNFDGPGTAYSRFWERLTSQNLVGVLELWVSIPDAAIYRVNYNYGQINGKL